MTAWETFLAFVTTVLGEDHDHVAALTAATPADVEDLNLAEGHDLTDGQVEILAGLYNVDTDIVSAVGDALVAAAQDENVDIAQVRDIADTVDGLRWVTDLRAEAEQAEDAERAELLSRLAPQEPEVETTASGDDDESDESGDDADESDDSEGGDAPDVAVEINNADEKVAVTAAAAPRIGNVSARRSTGGDKLKAQRDAAAAGSVKAWKMMDQVGSTALGTQVSDDEMVELMTERLGDFVGMGGRGHGEGVKHTLARLDIDYPEERDLTRFTKSEAGEYLAKYVREAQDALRSSSNPMQALTAAGGLCTPRQPLYDIPTLASAERPVQDFLPTFRAERGGITFRPGMSISSIGAVNTNASGIAIQTIAMDEAGVNKPILRVACPAAENSDVWAVPARLLIGNFLAQFDQEAVRAVTELQAAMWARIAETALLNAIDANSADVQTQTQGTATAGFARAYLNNVEQLVAGVQSRERARTVVLDHLAPFWLLDIIRQDLTLELPGSTAERLATADAEIDRFFASRNIRTGWFVDQQVIGAQLDEGNVTNYPNEVVSYIFEPGHHVALDGGRIEQGLYRDSALNQENDAETFMESFEGLASRGVASYALHSDVCITGATSAALDLACQGIS